MSDVVAKAGTASNQFGPDLAVVVELTVVAEHERSLDQWLLTVPEIDDRKTAMGKLHVDSFVAKGERTLPRPGPDARGIDP